MSLDNLTSTFKASQYEEDLFIFDEPFDKAMQINAGEQDSYLQKQDDFESKILKKLDTFCLELEKNSHFLPQVNEEKQTHTQEVSNERLPPSLIQTIFEEEHQEDLIREEKVRIYLLEQERQKHYEKLLKEIQKEEARFNFSRQALAACPQLELMQGVGQGAIRGLAVLSCQVIVVISELNVIDFWDETGADKLETAEDSSHSINLLHSCLKSTKAAAKHPMPEDMQPFFSGGHEAEEKAENKQATSDTSFQNSFLVNMNAIANGVGPQQQPLSTLITQSLLPQHLPTVYRDSSTTITTSIVFPEQTSGANDNSQVSHSCRVFVGCSNGRGIVLHYKISNAHEKKTAVLDPGLTVETVMCTNGRPVSLAVLGASSRVLVTASNTFNSPIAGWSSSLSPLWICDLTRTTLTSNISLRHSEGQEAVEFFVNSKQASPYFRERAQVVTQGSPCSLCYDTTECCVFVGTSEGELLRVEISLEENVNKFSLGIGFEDMTPKIQHYVGFFTKKLGSFSLQSERIHSSAVFPTPSKTDTTNRAKSDECECNSEENQSRPSSAAESLQGAFPDELAYVQIEEEDTSLLFSQNKKGSSSALHNSAGKKKQNNRRQRGVYSVKKRRPPKPAELPVKEHSAFTATKDGPQPRSRTESTDHNADNSNISTLTDVSTVDVNSGDAVGGRMAPLAVTALRCLHTRAGEELVLCGCSDGVARLAACEYGYGTRFTTVFADSAMAVPGGATCMAISPTHPLLALGHRDGTVRVHELSTFTHVATLAISSTPLLLFFQNEQLYCGYDGGWGVFSCTTLCRFIAHNLPSFQKVQAGEGFGRQSPPHVRFPLTQHTLANTALKLP